MPAGARDLFCRGRPSTRRRFRREIIRFSEPPRLSYSIAVVKDHLIRHIGSHATSRFVSKITGRQPLVPTIVHKAVDGFEDDLAGPPEFAID